MSANKQDKQKKLAEKLRDNLRRRKLLLSERPKNNSDQQQPSVASAKPIT